ncbi:mutant non-structural protein 6 [Rotavirus A]|uniref:Non-structural protein 6 n=1 Tax=Rotavirus A TaxID=28875 RepID=B3SRW6_9REOV|nr:mutant non-structural protein 6 [Rotavirus A]UZY23687.1 non-structural protein 6 [Rotavirus A]UZY23688.1 non-structural protein 6 [Rotavirus A]UZY23689.1 non-structural protein 6 [Rotavirus A]WKW89223.1 MAG: non-structural protein NSP6 [Rotavirus A]
MNHLQQRQLFLENLLVGVNNTFHQMQKHSVNTCCQSLQKILDHLILLQTIHSPAFRLDRMQLRQMQTLACLWIHQHNHDHQAMLGAIKWISPLIKELK